MRKIPENLKQEILADDFYKQCARKKEGNCQGRITWEHAIIYAGKQLNEKWAILPICAYHHEVDSYQDCGDLNKEVHVWIALNRASEDELRNISKAINYLALRDRLNKLYGLYS